ncbi:IS3 family transposase [Deinococcus radiophilus]|uniref:IS3 family transposase n=2 Tax=Deinococcus radiophilus TaxID=32062 RepID=A0A3S0KYJ0_9DEIO|nr:IS3 family transposase [Deinococcus radiophilus]RTR20514.1 IS3 family transposase [Deinococcus radiophilus]UFA51481.1 IS3 family transposase [Deinococcus radiophilus]
MTTRKTYTAEFKRQAIELAAREDVGPIRAARDLGISTSVLYRWRVQAQKAGTAAFPGQGRVTLTPQEQEIQRLRKENEILRQEREILKKGSSLLCQRKSLRFAFIAAHLKEFRLDIVCRVLHVTPSGFRNWRRRLASTRKIQDERLKLLIEDIYEQHKGRSGAPRIQAELAAKGHHHSVRRIARLMRDLGLYGKTRRKFVKTTDSKHVLPVAPNLLDRNFTPETPNSTWASDITYIPTKEGWLYLAVTMDLFARTIVGWSMDSTMATELPLIALNMAVSRRNPPAGLIHHSDRGSQYASQMFQTALRKHEMRCSMSRKGDCWDNAVVESFFETIKRELVDGCVYRSHEEAKKAIFEYMEVYYNRKRRHSSLGYLTPLEAECQATAA